MPQKIKILFSFLIILSLHLHAEVVDISAGSSNSLVVSDDGSLWATGTNDYGQRGDGSTEELQKFHKVISSGVISATAGNLSLFIKEDGSLWGMGLNSFGQLGDGTTENKLYPIQIAASGVIQAVIGGGRIVFLKDNGSLWLIGRHFSETELSPAQTPVEIVSSGVKNVSMIGEHCLFVKEDGSLWGIGQNTYGVLGDGSTDYKSIPIQIVASGVIQAATGQFHSLFVKEDGSLWGMGVNLYGQLGFYSMFTAEVLNPIQIISSGVSAVSAGDHHSVFLKSDGSLWGTGNNEYYQISDSEDHELFGAYQIDSFVSEFTTGPFSTLYTKGTKLYALGQNNSGQLGNGQQKTLARTTEVTPGVTILRDRISHITESELTISAKITNGFSSPSTPSWSFNLLGMSPDAASFSSPNSFSTKVIFNHEGSFTIIAKVGEELSAKDQVYVSVTSLFKRIPRYRLYNPFSFKHHFTSDSHEYSVLGSIGWHQEGVAYYVYDKNEKAYAYDIHGNGNSAEYLYRLYNPYDSRHLWTTKSNEYQQLSSLGWNGEGVDCHLFLRQVIESIPLYRLFNPYENKHLYTKDLNELNVLTTLGWRDEGIVGYVFHTGN